MAVEERFHRLSDAATRTCRARRGTGGPAKLGRHPWSVKHLGADRRSLASGSRAAAAALEPTGPGGGYGDLRSPAAAEPAAASQRHTVRIAHRSSAL